MDRLFRRIAFIGTIVTLLAAGALSGTYAKTGELLLLGRRPQPSASTLVTARNQTVHLRPARLSPQHAPSGESLRIVDMLPDSHSDDAKELPTDQRSDQGNAPSNVESSLVRLRVIDVEQNRKVSKPVTSSSNVPDDHASHRNQSLFFSEKSVSEAVEPRRVEPERKTWQLSAAPDLVPRDLRLSAGKPVQLGGPPNATVNKRAVRPAAPQLARPATSQAQRIPPKPLVSSVINTKNAHDDAAEATKTVTPAKAIRSKQVVRTVPKEPRAIVPSSLARRNQELTTKIARKNPVPVPTGSAAQIKPAEAKRPLVGPDNSTGKPQLAPRAVQPERVPVEQLVPPQAARKASTPRTEKPRVPEQRVVSRPPRSLPAISNQRFELVARISREHIRYGMDLAARGATRSARQEFIEVLNRVSQALDHTTGNHQYSHALNAGLTALREAEDFQTGDRRLSTEVDLQHLVATHQTTALKDFGAVQHLTPVMAMQTYLEYAKERLVFASGRQQVASGALYGLARLETLQTRGRPLDKPIRGPRAIALHQAALMVDKGNYAAANELGVLLARYGQVDSAADVLNHAAKLAPVMETWHNLARVYELKGAGPQAAHARDMFHRLRADALNSPTAKHENRQVYWVAPEMFDNQGNSIDSDLRRNPVAPQRNKVSQSSGDAAGRPRPHSKRKSSKAGHGPLHHFGRLMREKMASRPDAD